MHIIKALVKTIHKLEIDLGLPKNIIMNKLTIFWLHNLRLSSSLDSKHTTLMGFTNQSIVSVFETLTTPDKKGKKQSPIVDAGDVQKLTLVLPYVLDGWADDFIVPLNSRLAPANHVVDPFPDAIMAINEWLHRYYINMYVHIHTNTFIYSHIRIDTCIYINCMKSAIFNVLQFTSSAEIRGCPSEKRLRTAPLHTVSFKVRICMYMYVYVCICMYMHVFVRISMT